MGLPTYILCLKHSYIEKWTTVSYSLEYLYFVKSNDRVHHAFWYFQVMNLWSLLPSIFEMYSILNIFSGTSEIYYLQPFLQSTISNYICILSSARGWHRTTCFFWWHLPYSRKQDSNWYSLLSWLSNYTERISDMWQRVNSLEAKQNAWLEHTWHE